jgi:predicted nucleic acid-binding Zn ribbon protein
VTERDRPRPVSDALRHVRRELGTPAPGYFELIRDSWPELVGAALADHSVPSHLRSGVLRVIVDDPAWAGQFRYLADGLVQALGERVPEAGVREVSVVADRSPREPETGSDDDA